MAHLSEGRAARNIGVFAHVDAGKTTLTERMLMLSGAIRQAGAVDAGTAHTDKMEIERRRGISVRSTCANLTWKGVSVNLIDTPGHADFASEVERGFWALDGAILLLSAADGVQPQAENLFAALRRQEIPTILFINKSDREGADVTWALQQAKALLSPDALDFMGDEQMMARIAEEDDKALTDYLSGEIYPRDQLVSRISHLMRKGKAYPALSGSGLRGAGVEALLDAAITLLPSPGGDPEGKLSGVVFAVESGGAMGRAAHVRLYSGKLKNRDALELTPENAPPGVQMRAVQKKITQIRSVALEGRGEDLGELRAGEIGAIYGLSDARVGMTLGDPKLLPRRVEPGAYRAPLLLAKAVPDDPEKKTALRAALNELSAEDPLLQAEELEGEQHVRVMGKIQLEVLLEQLCSRFGIPVTFGPPTVIYRETIAKSSVGFFAYTMPKPCWAVIKFQIDPLPRGSGVRYESVVPDREILPRYQHQIAQAIPQAIRQGMLGWQVDDVQITLIGGEHHLIHTHPLDFILATPVAFMDGLRRGGQVLLEPILSLRISAPESCAGRLISEMVAMRGQTLSSEARAGAIHLLCEAPVSSSVDFPERLSQITGGRGALSVSLKGYRDCPTELGATCPRKGVNPLDTARYILAARSAMDGGIFTLY